MTNVAVKPGKNPSVLANKIHPLLVFDGYRGSYYWSNEYTKFFWIRVAILLIFIAGPAALALVSLWSFFGYLAVTVASASLLSAKNRQSKKFAHRQAYIFYRSLKDGWKSHGEVFYTQVWNHECHGDEGNSFSRGRGRSYVDCAYCDRRVVELAELRNSQRQDELTSSEQIDSGFFEASSEFRKAVSVGIETQTKAMKEISDSVGS